MANQITEGFDWFPSGKTDEERAVLWGSNSFFIDLHSATEPADVRTGFFNFGKAMSWNYNPGNFANRRYGYVIPMPDGPVNEGFIGGHFFRGKDCVSNLRCGVGIVDAVGENCQFFVSFSQYGVIRVYRGFPWQVVGAGDGPNTAEIAHSSAGAFEEDEEFHFEIYYKIGNTDGEVQVRINTVIKVDAVSVDNQSTSNNTGDSGYIGYGNAGTGLINFAVDNFFMNDTTGATMNDWSGNLRVKTQFMIADGDNIDFSIGGTSPAATNWQSVLNTNMDDSKYVYSPTIGDYDLYEPDPILNAPYVRVVQVRMGLRQDDATQRSAKAIIKLSGVEYENPGESFTNLTYTFYKQKWELNPDTGVSFTGAEVNGCQVGVKVES